MFIQFRKLAYLHELVNKMIILYLTTYNRWMFYSQFLLNNYFIPSSTHWNFIQNMVQLTCWPHPLFQISFMINQCEVYKWWTFVLSPLINCLTLNHVQFSNELLFSLLLIVMYNTLMFEVSPSGINYKSSWKSSNYLLRLNFDCNFVLPIVRLHGFVFFSYFLGIRLCSINRYYLFI